jgi:hypothetical protein
VKIYNLLLSLYDRTAYSVAETMHIVMDVYKKKEKEIKPIDG